MFVKPIGKEPLHLKIAGQMKAKLLIGNAGGYKLPSCGDLAKQFQVSVPTVRAALDELIQQGLLQVKKGSGYFVIEQERKKPVAILCDSDLSYYPNAATRIKGFLTSQNILRGMGYPVRLYFGEQVPSQIPERTSCRQFVEDLQHGELGGIMDVGGVPCQEWVQIARQQQIPVVGSGRYHEYAVRYDLDALLDNALGYLKKNGRKRIGFLGMRFTRSDPEFSDLPGVYRALQENGLKIYPEWLREDWHSTLVGAGWSSFREMWMSCEEKPDGLIVTTPNFLQDIYTSASELGIEIPKDLLVVTAVSSLNNGFKHVPRVELDNTVIVEIKCRMLHDLMEGREPNPKVQYVSAWQFLPAEESAESGVPTKAKRNQIGSMYPL